MENQEIDTSFSGITNQVNGNSEEGRKLVTQLILNYINTEAKIIATEDELERLKVERKLSRQGIDYVFKHLEKEQPCYVPIDSIGIVKVTPESIEHGIEIF